MTNKPTSVVHPRRKPRQRIARLYELATFAAIVIGTPFPAYTETIPGAITAEQYLLELDDIAQIRYIQGVVDGVMFAYADPSQEGTRPQLSYKQTGWGHCLDDLKIGRIQQGTENLMRANPAAWAEPAASFVIRTILEFCIVDHSD